MWWVKWLFGGMWLVKSMFCGKMTTGELKTVAVKLSLNRKYNTS